MFDSHKLLPYNNNRDSGLISSSSTLTEIFYRQNNIMSTITEEYINKVLPSLSPYHKKKMGNGLYGYALACPFCSHHQTSDNDVNNKCAVLSPIKGSQDWIFACSRGISGGKGNHQCSHSMKFDWFLRKWNPPLHRKYAKQRQAGFNSSLDWHQWPLPLDSLPWRSLWRRSWCPPGPPQQTSNHQPTTELSRSSQPLMMRPPRHLPEMDQNPSAACSRSQFPL